MRQFGPGVEVSSIVAHGEFAPSDFGITKFAEPGGLSYLQQPLYCTKSITSEGEERFDVVSAHPPLEGLALLHFLCEVAPNGAGDTLRMVIADWDLIERAAQKDLSSSSDAARLVGFHQRLGQSWPYFLPSRPLFLEVFRDAVPPEFVSTSETPTGRTIIPEAELDTETLIWDIAKNRPGRYDSLVRACLAAGMEEGVLNLQLGRLINHDRARDQQIRRGKVGQFFSSDTHDARKSLIVRLLRTFDEEQKIRFFEAIKPEVYEIYTAETGNRWLFPRRLLMQDNLGRIMMHAVVRADNRHKATVLSVAAKLPSSPGYGLKSLLVPESIHELRHGAVMSPLLAWKTAAAGRRTVLLEPQTEVNGGNHHRDGVMGLLLAAYFAPEVRQSWPKDRTLGPNTERKPLGVAQVPVLALMERSHLLDTPLIAALEAAV